jgi:hypothetical protein
MLGIGDLVQVAQGISQTLGKINQQLQALSRLSTGTFTMAAAATKVIADTSVAANSVVTLTPTNAAAGTLQQSTETLYISAISPGVSFTVATADGGSAAGTEQFSYLIYTPV